MLFPETGIERDISVDDDMEKFFACHFLCEVLVIIYRVITSATKNIFFNSLVKCHLLNYNMVLTMISTLYCQKVNTDYISQAQVLNIDNFRLIIYL